MVVITTYVLKTYVLAISFTRKIIFENRGRNNVYWNKNDNFFRRKILAMGCDIHMCLEKQLFAYDDKERKNGIWVNADTWQRDGYYEVEVATNSDTLEDEFGSTADILRGWEIPYEQRIYSGRNYDLFAILANVRNGRGFAGVPTGEGFDPISMPKGIPADCHPITKAMMESYGCDGHSHSWITLRELLDYDWEGQRTVSYGVVNEKEYKVFKAEGMPNAWAGMTFGKGVIQITNDMMDKMLSGELERGTYEDHENKEQPVRYITSVKWPMKYSECCHWFLEDTIPKLKSFVREFKDENEKKGVQRRSDQVDTAEDLRIVFFFDN